MDAETFWKNVSVLMKEKKISQDQISSELGISVNTFRGFISKKILPRVDVAKKIADYLNTSVDFLLTGSDKPPFQEKYENLKKRMSQIIDEC